MHYCCVIMVAELAMAQPFMQLLLLLLIAAGSWRTVSTLQFNYPTSSSIADFTKLDNASYSRSVIWLTGQSASSEGRFVYGQLVQFRDDYGRVASFSTSFTFQIITEGVYGQSGDGMAFFIAPNISAPDNSTGGCLGLVSGCPPLVEPTLNASRSQPSRHLFAVEFDIFENQQLNDPSSSHIGIDINSLDSIATVDTQRSYPDLSLYGNYTFTVWIDYEASNMSIQVWMTNSISMERPVDPIISTAYDLSIVFLNYMYVGFSASAGASNAAHVLYSWNFTSGLEMSPAPAPSYEASFPPMLVPKLRTSHGAPKRKLGLDLGLSLFLAVATSIAVALALWYCKTQRSSNGENDHNIDSDLNRYTYRELSRATQSFSDRHLLGEGAFSRVYKGVMSDPDRSTVAVKKLNEGLGKKAAFLSEIRIISSIRHRNLLRLRGWCHEKGNALLVYDYMPNGNLDRYLFGGNKEVTLTSEKRFNILLGVAAALEYLHEGLGECVLHRDIKAANVLLTTDFRPVLGDFGFARLIGHDRMVTMTAAGTPGYVAPEVLFMGKATDRADVYSFGVLALEVACGRRVLDYELPPQEMMLVERVWLLQESNKLMEAMDSRMMEITEWDADMEARWRCVLHVGLICCHPLPEARPRISQVHQALKERRFMSLPPSRPDFPYSTARPASTQRTLPNPLPL